MPALPWTSSMDPEPDREYLILLSHLPLRRMRTTPRFGRFVQAIRKQLVGTPGLVGYSLLAKPLRREYWTLSVWENDGALKDFVQTPPHTEVMRALRAELGPTSFTRWQATGRTLPPSWTDALAHSPGEA